MTTPTRNLSSSKNNFAPIEDQDDEEEEIRDIELLTEKRTNVVHSEIQIEGTNKVEKDKPEEEEEEKYFENSTHQYLIYWDKNTIFRSLIALSVIFVQLFIYAVCLKQAITTLTDKSVPVSIKIDTEDICSQLEVNYLTGSTIAGATYDFTWFYFTCDYEIISVTRVMTTLFAFVILGSWIMYDVISSINLLSSSKYDHYSYKIGAFIILIENIFAIIVGSAFACSCAWYNGSYDIIIGTIGILFVHDIDEKLMEGLKALAKNETKCCKCCNYKLCSFTTTKIIIYLYVVMIIGGITFSTMSIIASETSENSVPSYHLGYTYFFLVLVILNIIILALFWCCLCCRSRCCA